VIIHDAVRPAVDEDTVLAVTNAALEHGVGVTYYMLLCLFLVVQQA